VLDLLETTSDHRLRLKENTAYFRKEMAARGFDIVEGSHPIVPVMLGDARLAANIAKDMLDEGIYVVGFSYPVVPKEKARIRVQLSAAHTREQVERAIDAFTRVGRKHGVI
jgi:glycine C-acetyltransferase